MNHTSDFKQYCYLGTQHNNAGWDCFKTLTLPEILRTQNGLQEDFCACLEVIHLFQLVGSARNKHLFHSSTEAGIISLDAGLRMDEIPALDLWDFVVEVFHSSLNQLKKSKDRVQ